MKRTQAQILSYTALIQEDEDGNHLVSFPALPGCHTFGRTFDEALRMGREVLDLWLEELMSIGEPLPTERISSMTVMRTRLPHVRRRTHSSYASAHRQTA